METHDFGLISRHNGHQLWVGLITEVEPEVTRKRAVLSCKTCGSEPVLSVTEPKALRVLAGDNGHKEFACPWCEISPVTYTDDDAFTISGLEVLGPKEAKTTLLGTDYEEDSGTWLCRNCVNPITLPEGWELDYA